jgi:hypothetical protein
MLAPPTPWGAPESEALDPLHPIANTPAVSIRNELDIARTMTSYKSGLIQQLRISN